MIGFITRKPATDTTVWSGTTSFIYKAVCDKYDNVVNIIIPRLLLHKLANYFIRLITFNKVKFSFVDVFFTYIEIKIKQKKISKCEMVFCVAQSELIGNGAFRFQGKIIHISDATYHLMLNYYFKNVPVCEQRILDKLELNALRKADYIFLASTWARDDAVRHYKISKSKVFVDLFGANLPDEFNGYHNKTNNIIKLLLVGVDWSRKGVDTAIKVVDKLNSMRLNFTFCLTVVGVTVSEGKLEQFRKRNIFFAGKINKDSQKGLDRLSNIYRCNDIFILPTKAECAGIVFCEASMYGLPSLTYATGGVPSYVEDGYNGYLLDPSLSEDSFVEKILFLIQDNHLFDLQISSRRKYENSLNWKHWIDVVSSIVDV